MAGSLIHILHSFIWCQYHMHRPQDSITCLESPGENNDYYHVWARREEASSKSLHQFQTTYIERFWLFQHLLLLQLKSDSRTSDPSTVVPMSAEQYRENFSSHKSNFQNWLWFKEFWWKGDGMRVEDNDAEKQFTNSAFYNWTPH